MNHPQMTAMIATQHGRDLQRRSAQARRGTKADAHGIRVVKSAPAPAPRGGVWSRVAGAFARTTAATPAPELNLKLKLA